MGRIDMLGEAAGKSPLSAAGRGRGRGPSVPRAPDLTPRPPSRTGKGESFLPLSQLLNAPDSAENGPGSRPAADLVVMNADGAGVIGLTRQGDNTDPAWSPDGRSLLFRTRTLDRQGRPGPYQLSVVAADGSSPPQDWEGLTTPEKPEILAFALLQKSDPGSRTRPSSLIPHPSSPRLRSSGAGSGHPEGRTVVGPFAAAG